MQEQAVIQNQETELFKNYELRGWELNPRIYKILAASLIVNIFIVVGLAKANFLTAKSCDTAIMSSVCSVLDALYVGSDILSADSEFVSKDYENTEISENDEIIMVDMTGEYPPLEYPAGYFALANQNDFMAMPSDPNMLLPQPFDTTGMPNNPTAAPQTDLLNTNPNLPPQNDNVIQGEMPSSPLGTTTPSFPKIKTPRIPKSSKTKPLKNDSPKTLPNTNGETTAENKSNENQKPVESDSVKEIEINKKPFEDLGDSVNEKLAKNEIDLNKPFTVVLDGALTADGKFDPKKTRFVKTSGDEKMVDVAKSALEAIGNSGFLGYLKNSGVEKVNFTLVQDDKQIYAIIVSDQKTPEKASTTASGLNTMLSALVIADKSGLKKLDDNSRILLNNSKVTSDGKNFVLNFTLPKADAQNLINQTLKERAEKKASQPNTKTEIGNNNTNAQVAK